MYKFLNDKFVHEIKQLDENIKNADNWEDELNKLSVDDYFYIRFLLTINPVTSCLESLY